MPGRGEVGGSTSLDRFIVAQAAGLHERALLEVRTGRKTSHWMWFVYPQLRGLGRSEISRFYGIESLAEAEAYLAHPVVGPRLREAAAATLAAPDGLTAEAIFGPIDAIKLRSSMTLFHRVAPEEAIFGDVLDRFFEGREDAATVALLDDQAPGADVD
jgi:uncharacterized protein (DUF1810 family)